MSASRKGLVCGLGLILFVAVVHAATPVQVKPSSVVMRAQDGGVVELSAPVLRDQEVVSGTFNCSAFLQGYPSGPSGATLSFVGTAGITASAFEVGGAEVNNPSETCESLRTQMIAEAQSLGCATGQVRTSNDGYYLNLNFKFVCHGRRDDVVRAIGELGKKLLTETP